MRNNRTLLLFMFLLCTGLGLSKADTDFYRVEKKEGAWWFTAPNGMPFFSLGVDVTDMGSPKEQYDTKNPGYSALRHYPDSASWAQATLTRLREWNFNTLGAWSETDILGKVGGFRFPYTIDVELGASVYPAVPWGDLFSPEMERQFDALARKQVLPRKDDPDLLGYFTDNELGWWGDTIFLYFLKQPPQNATRQVLMRLLREHYHDDFKELQRDFETGNSADFDALEQNSSLTLHPGGQGMAVIDKFLFLLAQRYYRLAHDAIRRYDKHHLILGDRYASWYTPAVARAAHDYVDVVSLNYGADWEDGSLSPFFLDSLHRLTGKPIVISEFYFCAMENRSGNKNSSAGFPTVQTQKERADGFRTNLETLLAQPFVVGAHWFQYYDEPSQGRKDGENYNMGLVDINDRPYEELTSVTSALKIPQQHHDARPTPANGPSVLPPAPSNPEKGLRGWDKTRARVRGGKGIASSLPFADLYTCWDPDHLYVAIYAADYVDTNLYTGGVIPPGERMEWVLSWNKEKSPLRVRFGAGGKAIVEGAQMRVQEWPGLKSTVLLTLPASLFGKSKFQAGDTLDLHATLASHSRAQRMEWNASLQLGSL